MMTKPENFSLFVKLWRWRCAILLLPLVILCIFLLVYFGVYALVLPILLIPAWGFLMLHYIPAYFRRFHWEVQDDSLIIHGGVWWERSRSIPLDAVQFLTVHNTPLSRHFGLFAVTVHMIGGINILPCVTKEALTELQEAVA